MLCWVHQICDVPIWNRAWLLDNFCISNPHVAEWHGINESQLHLVSLPDTSSGEAFLLFFQLAGPVPVYGHVVRPDFTSPPITEAGGRNTASCEFSLQSSENLVMFSRRLQLRDDPTQTADSRTRH